MKQKANLCNCEHKIKRKDIDIKGSLILWSRVDECVQVMKGLRKYELRSSRLLLI